MNPPQDTIVAIATATGRGAIGVVRFSGPAVPAAMRAICGELLRPRYATHCLFLDAQGDSIDDGLALYFPAPHSYTGEDVLELQGHGGPGVLALLLGRCLQLSSLTEAEGLGLVRQAMPGEFTQRAFMNNKIDLVQAEAVADLIEAGSERAARSALASLQGVFSARVQALLQALTDLRMRVEACLDFPEEDIDFIAQEAVSERLADIRGQLKEIDQAASRGAVLREGLRVVLVGAPNVGKSSLLNALANEDVALVTEIEGTTRDRIIQEILMDGVPIQVIDTAGLRQTADVVEQLGMARTWTEISTAQVVLLLEDASGQVRQDQSFETEIIRQAASAKAVIRVMNKADLIEAGRSLPKEKTTDPAQEDRLYISAKTGLGLDALRARLLAIAGWSGDASSGVFSARARHLHALTRVQAALDEADTHLKTQSLELLAASLRLAQDALSEITGEFTSDDLLGEIFGRFCIGK
jgi:tRNA modification GTPase